MKHVIKSAAFLCAVAIGIGFSSCKSVKPIEKSVKPIENTQLAGYWVLKTIDSKNVSAEFEGAKPSIEFDFEKSTIHGSGGCNRYTGGYNLTSKNEFSAPNLATTMMLCVDKNAEPQFLKLLSTPKMILSINEKGLLTLAQGEKVILEFEKGEAPTVKVGTNAVNAETLAGLWTLKTLIGGDLSKLFADKKPTINFAEEGKVSGNGGCNNYRMTYTLTDNTIVFTPGMSTKMACPNLEGESKFLKAMEATLQATINNGTLTLSKYGAIVMEFVKAE